MRINKMRMIALMITLAAVMTGLNTEAQRREYRKSDNVDRNQKQYYSEHKKNNKDYRKYDQHRNLKSTKKQYSNRYEKHKRNEHLNHANRSQRYSKNNRYMKNRYENRSVYQHPRYGQVVRNFRTKPLRLKHHCGDYYFSGGNYYKYHPRVGYVHVELPRHMVFSHLPSHCEPIVIGHHVYYSHGDLLFEQFGQGYRLAPSFNIQLSAHF